MERKSTKKQSKGNDCRRLFGRLLIVVGSILMCAVAGVNALDYYRSRSAVAAFVTEKEQVLVSTGEPPTGNVTVEAAPRTLIAADVLGLLRIPKIDLEEAVKEGTSSNVISSALGHMEDTAMPGAVGNCAIAGHRNYVFGRFFNRLNEIETGDTIELETMEATYVYTVTDSFVVEPEDISVLEQDMDTQEITLITCTPLFVGSHRLIIRGVLTEAEP